MQIVFGLVDGYVGAHYVAVDRVVVYRQSFLDVFLGPDGVLALEAEAGTAYVAAVKARKRFRSMV